MEKREVVSFDMAYENMQEILDHPEQYTEKITHFSAGGLGACVYSHDVSVAELVCCWQREEYRVECPKCKSEAYIVSWAGHVNAGGYWSVRVFCPHCKNEYKISGIGLASWRRMREISNEVTKELNTNN